MIVREWRGRAAHASKNRYPEHFRRNVLPTLRQIDGFVGAQLCKQQNGNDVEFLVLSRWQSLEAVKAFAGSDYGRAIVESEAMAALTSFDARVRHYEVVEEA